MASGAACTPDANGSNHGDPVFLWSISSRMVFWNSSSCGLLRKKLVSLTVRISNSVASSARPSRLVEQTIIAVERIQPASFETALQPVRVENGPAVRRSTCRIPGRPGFAADSHFWLSELDGRCPPCLPRRSLKIVIRFRRKKVARHKNFVPVRLSDQFATSCASKASANLAQLATREHLLNKSTRMMRQFSACPHR